MVPIFVHHILEWEPVYRQGYMRLCPTLPSSDTPSDAATNLPWSS
jgi:hypothetical protein